MLESVVVVQADSPSERATVSNANMRFIIPSYAGMTQFRFDGI
jgi:hypothetical protein